MKMRHTALLAAALVALAGCSSHGADDPTTGTTAGEGVPADSTESVPAEVPDTSSDDALPEELAAMLDGYGVSAEDGVRAAIMTLDSHEQERPLSVQGQVRTGDVVFSDGEQEIAVPIPGDLVYVSIAPYVDQTHECFFHSLTTCKGELGNEEINVQVIDDSGKTLVDESVQTYDNGFVGLWLPRDINGTITIEHQGRSVTDSISTGQDDPTCITTLQLT